MRHRVTSVIANRIDRRDQVFPFDHAVGFNRRVRLTITKSIARIRSNPTPNSVEIARELFEKRFTTEFVNLAYIISTMVDEGVWIIVPANPKMTVTIPVSKYLCGVVVHFTYFEGFLSNSCLHAAAQK